MTEFDDTTLNKDFSDQPLTSLTDLANRMRGPQYRSALASQDRRASQDLRSGLDQRPSQDQRTHLEDAAQQSSPPAVHRHDPFADPFARAAEAWEADSARAAEAAQSAEQFESENWDQGTEQTWDPSDYDASQDPLQDPLSEPWQAALDPLHNPTFEPVMRTGSQHDQTYQSGPSHAPAAEEGAGLDAQSIDAALADLSPDTRDWQSVAWHQEGPVSGHLVNGNLRATRRADLKAALSFDYAADDHDDQAYVPAYRPAARVPGFARAEQDAAHTAASEQDEALGPDLRAAGEAMAAERHSLKQAEIGYRLSRAGSAAWQFCRAASVPQMAMIAGGVASSVVMGLVIWSLVSEPSLREPLYLAARPGPEKQVPADPGGMHIANLGMSVLSQDEEPGAVQILEGGHGSVMDLTLAPTQIPAGNASLESIDDLILAELPANGEALQGENPASIDQLIALAALGGESEAARVQPLAASLVQDEPASNAWPPLPRRKEAAVGRPVAALDSPQPQASATQPSLNMNTDLGAVSAAAPLSKQDDLGALVEEVEADPIWELLMNDSQLSGSREAEGALQDDGEGAMPLGRSPQESPAALMFNSPSMDGLHEAKARSDLTPLLALDDGLHTQAGLLGNFANWVVPSARAVGEQLAQLRADGQGGLVAAPEAPVPQPVASADEEAVVVPDGPWSPPLLPAEAIEPYGLQLASYRSLNSARRSWEKFKAKHPSLLKDLVLRVQQAQVAGRGTFYRLQVGPFPNELTALDVCQQLRQQGHRSCIVVKK